MVYLPTFIHKNQPNVGKYTIHGSYGIYTLFQLEYMCFLGASALRP